MTASPFLTLHELVKKARQKLNHDPWDYIVGGAETETTLRRNRLALDSIAFRPRVLRDVSRIDASTRFLGRTLRLPVVLAPVGGLELFAPEGGTAAVRAAQHLVGIARMQCIGLAADGQAGLMRVLELLEEEVRLCLGLLGVNAWGELDQSYLHAAPPVSTGAALGAFPLLTLEDQTFY